MSAASDSTTTSHVFQVLCDDCGGRYKDKDKKLLEIQTHHLQNNTFY